MKFIEINKKIFYDSFKVDSYYSLAYASPRGNLRSWFKTVPAGEPLDCHVAKFRLKIRQEVQINWHLLTMNAIYFTLGKYYDIKYFLNFINYNFQFRRTVQDIS